MLLDSALRLMRAAVWITASLLAILQHGIAEVCTVTALLLFAPSLVLMLCYDVAGAAAELEGQHVVLGPRPSQWTVDEVAVYFGRSALPEYGAVFKRLQIDGYRPVNMSRSL